MTRLAVPPTRREIKTLGDGFGVYAVRVSGRPLGRGSQPSAPVVACGSPTGLDCDEPRCRSHTEKSTMEATARNSDFQFCSVRFQKSDEPAYCHSSSAASWWSSCVSLYSTRPVTSCANHEPAKMTAMTISREFA